MIRILNKHSVSTLRQRLARYIVSNMDYTQIITMEPGKRSGKPCIRGTRMAVVDVLSYLAAGMTHSELLDDFRISPSKTSLLALHSPLTGNA